MSSQEPHSSQLSSAFLINGNELHRTEFLKQVFEAVESNKFHTNENIFQLMCQRVSELDATEFDAFISSLFEYLIQWEEKRNFELLGLMVELFDVVLGIVPPALKLEIKTALTSMDSWHVKLFVCWELFGHPEIEFTQEKLSDSTLPLELYLNCKSKSQPAESLINRIYSLKDDLTFKFCSIVLHQIFGVQDLTNFQTEIEQIKEKVKVLKCKHGSKAIPRIRHALSQELLRADS